MCVWEMKETMEETKRRKEIKKKNIYFRIERGNVGVWLKSVKSTKLK